MNFELARYLPTFIQAAETLNFSAAARNLGVTPAAVSKSIKALENEIGIRLFHRSTHSLSLTDEGERFYHKIEPIIQQFSEVLSSSQSLQETPRGRLRVSLPYGFGKLYFLPHIKSFKETYPEIELDLRFEDRAADLIEESIDVAVGNRINRDSRIIARQLCPLNLITLASPEFLALHGEPAHPGEIANFPSIGYRSPTSGRIVPWPFVDDNGNNITLDFNHDISVNNVVLMCELAKQSIGLTMLGTWLAQPFIDDGTLVPVLEQYATEGPAIMIYYASRQNLPAKTRVFIDYMTERFNTAFSASNEI